MNAILKNALASRKKMVDETSSTCAIGSGQGSITDDKPTTAKLPFYTGNMVDKSSTGFTGLLNQGATCYLNSLIQSLFMTPELREAVFEWRYDATRDPEPKRCIPLQLQRLFAQLQISIKGAVATRDLTTSFGWTGREVYQQHDVMELFNVLFENLETQAFGSKLAMVVSDLHRGSYKDYVQCLNCKTMRGRDVPFVGLGLELTSADSFDVAMKQYITPEILDGGNKVTCPKCDAKQDSKKGIRLTTLPYFLGIHLKRWTFNFATLQRIKLTKKISFPRTFNGAIYLNCDGNSDDNTQEEETEKEYELYSMMIHTGGATGGHYFAYIKDFKSGKWLQFNDSNVREIPPEDMEEWFNPKVVEEAVEETDNKQNNEKDDKTITPAPIPTAVKPSTADSDGMDIGAAIAQNLKDKQQKDLKAKLAEQKTKKLRFLHPFGAAYMLMYRLIDDERNVISVADDLIASDIVSEIETSDGVYAKQKAEYDRLRQYITLKIHFDGKVSEVMVKKKESMKCAVDRVYNELKLLETNGVANADCLRLRNMKVLNNIPLEPYDDDKLEDLIESFEFHDPKHLILETRGEDEAFATYEREKISLRVVELDVGDEKMKWKKEVLVQVDENATIGALRQAIASSLGVDSADRIRMAFLNEGMALLLSEDKSRIKKDERILNGYYVHCEVCDEHHTEGKSKLMDKFDKQLNTLRLHYNELEFDSSQDNIFSNPLEIDVRTTVGELRAILAKKLGIEVSECVLRKGWHSQELKDNAKTLEQYRVHTNCQVFVEKGTPLAPTQYLFQIFIEDEAFKAKKRKREEDKWKAYLEAEKAKETAAVVKAEEKEKEEELGAAFLFVGDCVLDSEWPMDKVKREITQRVANVPPANQMRLRSFNDHNRLLKVYLDSKTLGKNLKKQIKDYTQICCQRTAKTNEVLNENMMLLYVARWFPDRMDFGEQIEFALNKKTKIKSELREELSALSGIAVEHIRCEHPRAYLLKNVENRRKVCILDWENSNCTANTTLVSKQWKCKNGEFILYKDNRQKERLTKDDFATKSITFALGSQREEALVFYSPQQQIEREKEKKEKEEANKKEMQQAQQDAIQRIKQSKDVAAKAAQKSMQKALNT
eukprot:352992_1